MGPPTEARKSLPTPTMRSLPPGALPRRKSTLRASWGTALVLASRLNRHPNAGEHSETTPEDIPPGLEPADVPASCAAEPPAAAVARASASPATPRVFIG